MDKLQAMKQQMEEVKKRLDTVSVFGEAANGAVKITLTGNRKVTAVYLSPELLQRDKEELEDLLIIAMNKAIENADSVNESEMQSSAAGMMPNLKDMFK